MRVLHIVGDSSFGGGSVMIQRIAEAARTLGCQVDVLTTDPVFQKVLRDTGIGSVALDVIWRDIRPFRDMLGCYRLYRYLAANRYDIVHTHTSKAGFVGRLAASRAGVPVVVHTVHGFAFHEQSGARALRLYSALERLAARWCTKLVTVSEYHRDWAIRLGIGTPEKVTAIPNGIPVSRVTPVRPRGEVRATWGVGDDVCVMLATGRMAEQKGFTYLIQAMPLLKGLCGRPCKLIFAGDGPLRGELEGEVQRLGLGDVVQFVGFQSDVGSLLAASDMVVLPSLWEGLSIALLEAMAAGKPVVTTTIGSNLEVESRGSGMLLVPPKDPSALASAIAKVATDPALSDRMSRQSQDVVNAYYTEERMLQQYKDLYVSLLRGKGLLRGTEVTV